MLSVHARLLYTLKYAVVYNQAANVKWKPQGNWDWLTVISDIMLLYCSEHNKHQQVWQHFIIGREENGIMLLVGCTYLTFGFWWRTVSASPWRYFRLHRTPPAPCRKHNEAFVNAYSTCEDLPATCKFTLYPTTILTVHNKNPSNFKDCSIMVMLTVTMPQFCSWRFPVKTKDHKACAELVEENSVSLPTNSVMSLLQPVIMYSFLP